MDEESWSTVDFNVLLNGCLLGVVSITLEASIKKSESVSHSVVNEELADWPVNVEEHGSDQGVTNIIEPVAIEIRLASSEDSS
jgi:hypothetical protein